jgi:surface antigen
VAAALANSVVMNRGVFAQEVPKTGNADLLAVTIDRQSEVDSAEKMVADVKQTLESNKKEAQLVEKKVEESAKEIQQIKSEIEELKARIAEKKAEKERKKREAASKTVSIGKYAANSAGNGYAAGNCTWYVKSRRPDIGSYWGNANQWIASAQAAGFSTGSAPKQGAIGVSFEGYYGHVVYVESVSEDGSTVNLSEMNAKGLGVISSRTAPASSFQYIYSRA